MNKFFIKTMGCKTNQLENEIIANNLSDAGFVQVYNFDEADYYILNSCAVTEVSANESLYYLRNIKNKSPKITTVLTGCVAQLEHERLQNDSAIDIIVGNNEKLSIAEYLRKNTASVQNIFEVKEFNHKFIRSNSRTRANLKIQDGCNNRCAYCTIPFARGNSRSNSVENIIEQIKIFTVAGINEIILTGIHIGQWGLEFKDGKTLIDLLKEIEKTDIHRYRLGSLEPPEITDELIGFLSNSNKFCPHFHISIQSLCDKTLKAMNRHYNSESVLEIIEKLNKTFDKPFLGCDIIVGFPEESEEDFDTTYNNLKMANLSQIHVFPYSKRSGTPAATMENQIDENTKKTRAGNIKKLSNEKYHKFLEDNLNTIHEVQVQKNKNSEYFKGITRNYIDVLITSGGDIRNKICNVKIIGIDDGKIYAELLS